MIMFGKESGLKLKKKEGKSKETLHTFLYGLVMKQIKNQKKNPVKPIVHIYPAMNHT